jgi:hypothetical protein
MQSRSEKVEDTMSVHTPPAVLHDGLRFFSASAILQRFAIDVQDVPTKKLGSLRYPSSRIVIGDFQLIFLYRM